jgi:hypothetical protein
MPDWLRETLRVALELSHARQLALAFLLGSFVVATWSDLKYLAAQREFLEVWLLFIGGMLVFDVYTVRWEKASSAPLLLKWALVAVCSVLSLREVGVLFRLARGDVAALAAAACLLTPVLVVVFYLVAKALSLVLGPLLARGRRVYPFMPVVTLATVAVQLLGWLVAPA